MKIWLPALITALFPALVTAQDMAKPYQKAQKMAGGDLMTEIVFDKGSHELGANAERQLADLLKRAEKAGRLERVKIVAWADADYPNSGKGELGKDAQKLADNRAYEVKGFFEDRTRNVEVDLHNMAKEPLTMAEVLKTDDAEMKKALDKAGFTEQRANSPARISRALVLVTVKR